MADNALTDEEMDAVAQEFVKQKEKAGPDTFEHCHKLVVDMGSILTHLR